MDMITRETGLKYNSKVYHINDGYFYQVKNFQFNRVQLVCATDKKCRARASMPLVLEARSVGSLRVTKRHNHIADASWLELALFRKILLERCERETKPIPEIYREEIKRVAPSFAAKLPLMSVRSAMFRARKSAVSPPVPAERGETFEVLPHDDGLAVVAFEEDFMETNSSTFNIADSAENIKEEVKMEEPALEIVDIQQQQQDSKPDRGVLAVRIKEEMETEETPLDIEDLQHQDHDGHSLNSYKHLQELAGKQESLDMKLFQSLYDSEIKELSSIGSTELRTFIKCKTFSHLSSPTIGKEDGTPELDVQQEESTSTYLKQSTDVSADQDKSPEEIIAPPLTFVSCETFSSKTSSMTNQENFLPESAIKQEEPDDPKPSNDPENLVKSPKSSEAVKAPNFIQCGLFSQARTSLTNQEDFYQDMSSDVQSKEFASSNTTHSESAKGLWYTCNICGEVYTDKSGLTTHQQNAHSQIKVLDCLGQIVNPVNFLIQPNGAIQSIIVPDQINPVHNVVAPLTFQSMPMQWPIAPSVIQLIPIPQQLDHSAHLGFVLSTSQSNPILLNSSVLSEIQPSTGASNVISNQTDHSVHLDIKPSTSGSNLISKGSESKMKSDQIVQKFICNKCGKIVDSERELFDHQRTHTRFQCNVCNVSFITRNVFETHKALRQCSWKKIYGCKYHCGETFSSVKDCVNHSKGQCYGITKRFVEHTKTPKTQVENVINCKRCGKSFEKREEYLAHSATHRKINDPLQFFCKKCNKSYEFRASYLSHKCLTGFISRYNKKAY